MKCDLIAFNISLLAFSHVFNLSNSIFIPDIIRYMELPTVKTDVSSENNIEKNCLMHLTIIIV